MLKIKACRNNTWVYGLNNELWILSSVIKIENKEYTYVTDNMLWNGQKTEQNMECTMCEKLKMWKTYIINVE